VFEALEQITKLVINAYRAEMPKGGRELATFLDASDEGLTDAIRGLTESTSAAANDESIAEVEGPPTKVLGSMPGAALQKASERNATPPPPSRGAIPALLGDGARVVRQEVSISHVEDVVQIAPTTSPTSNLFSFAELWPEGERDAIRKTEALLGARDAAGAVLACDLLLTRILASAASLAGSLEAPRDPGLVCLLLGLEGRRYLQFRTVVRAARRSDAVTLRAASDCLLFVLEARRAKDGI
jgi:mutual gliding-motility protein MglA